MLSNIVKILAGTIVLMGIVGCSQNTTILMGESQLDKNWGRAYETAKYNQIINHDAGENTEPVEGLDGDASESNMKTYKSGGSVQSKPATEFGVVTIKQ